MLPPTDVTCAPDPIEAVVVTMMTATPTEPATLVLDCTPPAAEAPITTKSLWPAACRFASMVTP
jgi:hypothetical protein